MKMNDKKMIHILIQAEDGLVGPASTYQSVTVFDTYEDAWAALLKAFNDYGGNGEFSETFGNAYVDDGRMVWQIITCVKE